MSVAAGFGSAVINPPTPVSLAGFGTPQLATEIHDDLQARALVLRSEAATVCLVVCDLLGMSFGFSDPARQAVASALDLPPAAVLIASTHTHSAPSAMEGTAVLGWETPEGFGATIADGCRRAAVAALAAVEPAEARYARRSLPEGLSLNRRGHPYDPYFSVLDMHRAAGGRIGTLANLAIHPVALGPECLAVSSDWVGPFRNALEDATGGAAMMLSGALGDVNPRHVHRQNNECAVDGFAEAAELGGELAQVIDRALASAERVEGGVGVVANRHLQVPLDGTGLSVMRPPGESVMDVELLEWSLGSLRVVSVPGEAFQAFGRQVESARDNRVILAGLAPMWQGYLPVPWEDGGYEEGVSYGQPAVNAILEALLDVPT